MYWTKIKFNLTLIRTYSIVFQQISSNKCSLIYICIEKRSKYTFHLNHINPLAAIMFEVDKTSIGIKALPTKYLTSSAYSQDQLEPETSAYT